MSAPQPMFFGYLQVSHVRATRRPYETVITLEPNVPVAVLGLHDSRDHWVLETLTPPVSRFMLSTNCRCLLCAYIDGNEFVYTFATLTDGELAAHVDGPTSPGFADVGEIDANANALARFKQRDGWLDEIEALAVPSELEKMAVRTQTLHSVHL